MCSRNRSINYFIIMVELAFSCRHGYHLPRRTMLGTFDLQFYISQITSYFSSNQDLMLQVMSSLARLMHPGLYTCEVWSWEFDSLNYLFVMSQVENFSLKSLHVLDLTRKKAKIQGVHWNITNSKKKKKEPRFHAIVTHLHLVVGRHSWDSKYMKINQIYY